MLDARQAEPFDINMPDPDAVPSWSVYAYQIINEFGGLWTMLFNTGRGPNDIRVGDLGTGTPVDELRASITGSWDVHSTSGSPQWYHSSWERTGTLLAGLTEAPTDDEFATVDTTLGLSSDQQGMRVAGKLGDLGSFSAVPADLPVNGVNHVLANGVPWSFGAGQWADDPEADWFDTLVQSAPREYAAGEVTEETYNVGVFGPSLTVMDWHARPGAFRLGDQFWAFVPTYGDGAGNPGHSRFSEATSSLRFNGEEVITTDGPLFYEDIGVALGTGPAGAGRFELSTDVSRPAEVSKVSSRVQATWAFDADAAPDGDEIQEFPLSVVRFSPELSPTSTAPAGQPMRIPFTVEGAAEGNVQDLTIEVSYDDGETWKPVKMLRGDQFLVKHPKKPGSVSLRANLSDNDGNTLEQTIHQAYLTVPASAVEDGIASRLAGTSL